MFSIVAKRAWLFIASAIGVVLLGTAIGWNLLIVEPPYKPGDEQQIQQQFKHINQCEAVGRTTPLGGGTGRLAYQVSSNGEGTKTYVICANGTGRTTLPVEAGNNPAQPDWSPDGKALLTLGWSTAVITEIDRNGNWLNSKRLSYDMGPTVGAGEKPRWSPDGKRIVLIGSRAETCIRDIWVVDVATEQPTRIIDHAMIPGADSCDGTIDLPSWSPDGGLIIFSSGRSLWLFDFTSGRVAQWLHLGNMFGIATRTDWTRAGLFYAAFSTDQNATRIFQIVPDMKCLAEGLRNGGSVPNCGTPVEITHMVRWVLASRLDDQQCPTEAHSAPAISPDGAYLAFVSTFYRLDGTRCIAQALITSVARPNEVFALDTSNGINTFDPVWQPTAK